jgi:hypothetical protein
MAERDLPKVEVAGSIPVSRFPLILCGNVNVGLQVLGRSGCVAHSLNGTTAPKSA